MSEQAGIRRDIEQSLLGVAIQERRPSLNEISREGLRVSVAQRRMRRERFLQELFGYVFHHRENC
jgi:hypothetical protein